MLAAMLAAVIPCFRVKRHILSVLAAMPRSVDRIYVVDDGCPEGSGDAVEVGCTDPRVRVLRHERNRGVGAATLTGYRAALADGANVIVRLDGDGQMDPALIPRLVRPIADGEADYTKGNRFFELEGLRAMPPLRLVGNSILSFASKLSSGYWNVFDPTNGFTAIHAAVLRQLPLDKLSPDWFFESDLLFRLGTIRAVVCDVPIPARYGDEESSLVVRRVIGGFAGKHLVNAAKRIFYGYYLRNFNIASIEIALGIPLIAFGAWIGVTRWYDGYLHNTPATSGTVMLAALPVLVGIQLVLAFLSYDLQNVPRDVLHRRLDPPA
jgi:dolichol-phosphate mannosyltransferase